MSKRPPYFPDIDLEWDQAPRVPEGLTIKFSTMLRKKHTDGLYYNSIVSETYYFSIGEFPQKFPLGLRNHMVRFNTSILMWMTFGIIHPDLRNQDGDLVFEKDSIQDPEDKRLLKFLNIAT